MLTMRPLLRTIVATLAFFVLASDAWAQYPYRRVPKVLYIVGQPTWDELAPGDGSTKRLLVFDTPEDAQRRAGGKPVYRILRHLLDATPDGKAFLEAAEKARLGNDAAQLEFVLSNPASLDETVLKRAKSGSDLGPANPHWKTSGDYDTKSMEGQYRPGASNDDYSRGTFYFWNEGVPAQVDFINNFKIHFVEQNGKVLLMQQDPNKPPGNLRPIDTRGLFNSPGAPTPDLNTCLFVMDAAGNFYAIAPEWVAGLAEAYGLSGINHSSIPAGHPVAAAGHMTIENGVLKLIDNRSGHYHPSNAMTVQAIQALRSHRIEKGTYRVGFGNGATDHPGEHFISLDPDHKAKIERGDLERSKELMVVSQKPASPTNRPRVDDAALLHPPEPNASAQLDKTRRDNIKPATPVTPDAAKPVAPPDAAIIEAIRQKIKDQPVAKIDAAFLRGLYSLDPTATKLVGQIMADPALSDKNIRMGEVRREMDLAVWKEILKTRNIGVEITNQGKSNGIRSDLDYTLYYVAENAGVSIEDLIKEHTETWKRLHNGMDPAQMEITVMNGDNFYPDWRTEALGEFEYQARVKEMLGRLRADKGAYSVPGANKQQVHNRALRDGHTELLRYDASRDKPGVPIEQQVVRDAGRTADLAERYRGVHAQYNHMNALGTVVQNMGEYLHQTGDGAQDAARRAKYGNRIINEGLGNLRRSANDYAQLFDNTLPNRDELKLQYLKRAFGLLVDDNGKPAIDDATLRHFRDVIDISMQIELDKTGNRQGKKADYNSPLVRAEYFKQYLPQAEQRIGAQYSDREFKAGERRKLVLAEQERLFEADHRRVLAEAVLAGLRHTVARDLTAEGVLRNRVRFDPATNQFVVDDKAGANKVASERALEVALFYELVNGIDDPFLRHDMKKRALSTAPSIEIAQLYGALDQVNSAEIDRLIKGEPDGKVQRTIDDLLRKQQQRALELATERKEKIVADVKARGIPVEPTTVAPDAVRDQIVSGRMWTLNPEHRVQFTSAFRAMSTRVSGDFREAFYNNASGLMVGSSAVNLARAYQMGGAAAVPRALFSEAVNYMPDYIQTPLTVIDLAARVKQGQYGEAAWGAGVFGALATFPAAGHAMLGYNIVNGSFEIAHTYFVTRIDKDRSEQALKSRPRDAMGNPLAHGGLGPARARPNRFPDARESVYRGSPPGFPLYYGAYRNKHAIRPTATVDGVTYSDGSVPHDNLSDAQLADTAGFEFAAVIDSMLTAERLEVGSDAWARRAWELKLKFGFDIPFYRRIAKVYDEKFRYVTYYDNWPEGRLQPDILTECRLDVYDWYEKQPPGYKDELAGEARGLGAIFRFLSDQTDKMQEMIARECTVVMTRHHEAVTKAAEIDAANKAAFKQTMARAFDAERSLLAAKSALHRRIQADEEKAAAAMEQQALDAAKKHTTWFAVRYPFTYATEELPPNLEFDVRSLPANVKGPVHLTIEQELVGMKDGTPVGWQPGKAWEARFKPDASGWTALRPITVDVRFTARLLNADSVEVAQAKLDLPVVLYEPTVSASVTVTVYAMGEKGDSSVYNGALVTLGNETQTTGPLYGSTTFSRLAAGAHSVKVAPAKGDERHGPGGGAATVADVLLSPDPNARESASIVVKLPYIPEPKVVATKDESKPTTGGTTPATRKDSTGSKDAADSTTTPKTGKGSTTGPTIADVITKLTPITSKAEKTRDDAKAACKYIEAAKAQEDLVAAAKQFLASSFPAGAPPQVRTIAQGFEAELVALKKAATAQETANTFLREGLAAVRAKRAEPALTALEKAAEVPDIPKCLHDQVMSLYNEIKTDLEKRMKLIDQATDAANVRCDYAAAQKFGEQVEAEDATLSWVVRELPRIKDLNRRQQRARTLAAEAEAKAAEAEQLAQAGGDLAQANAIFEAALVLAQQALAAAPECEKANLRNLIDLGARKSAFAAPAVDQSLVLLLDVSGSMSDNNKMENAKQAATDAVKSLGPTTEIALISYDGGCAGGWRVVQAFTTNHQSLITAIAGLRPGGGTPTAPAVGFASDYLQKNGRGKSGQIMLMTDGQNDCGSMVDAGSGLRRSSIPLRIDAVGFGLADGSRAQSDLGELVRAAGGAGTTFSANSAKELISAFRRAFIANQLKARDPFVSGEAGTRLAQLFAAATDFLKQNNLPGAMNQLQAAATQFPASPAAAFNVSLGYEAAGQPLQAMNFAKKYLDLAPRAFDAGQVRARIEMLEKEQAANPRAIFAPADCGEVYRWAQRESRLPRLDAARKVRVLDIMTTAQRGDCAAAQAAYDKYIAQYGR